MIYLNKDLIVLYEKYTCIYIYYKNVNNVSLFLVLHKNFHIHSSVSVFDISLVLSAFEVRDDSVPTIAFTFWYSLCLTTPDTTWSLIYKKRFHHRQWVKPTNNGTPLRPSHNNSRLKNFLRPLMLKMYFKRLRIYNHWLSYFSFCFVFFVVTCPFCFR